MKRWKGKVAVVTGASSGIGAAIAEQLVRQGVKVVGFARRKEKVEKLAKKLRCSKGKLYAVKVDVSNENEVVEAFEWLKKKLGAVHILVNNAGFARMTTSLIDGDTQLWKEQIDTNVIGLSIVTREAVRNMKANKVDGHIIHINSIGGHKVSNIPGLNVYAATKYAVTALSQTLRHEFLQENLKIKVTSISPGYVKTEFAVASGLDMGPNSAFSNWPSLNPDDVSGAVLFALDTPPHVQVEELIITPVGGD